MMISLKKILIVLLAALSLVAFAGCALTTNPTTIPTTTEAVTQTTSTVITVTTTAPITATTTTAVTNAGIVLSGTWQNVYEFGEAFNPTGLVVTLVKSDASETIVTEYFVLGFNASIAGFQTVRIRHLGLEAAFVIYVKEAVVAADIALELTLPNKLVYEPGDAADWTGLVVTVVKSDGERIAVADTTYVVSGFAATTPGLVTITITYDELVATFPIYIADPYAGVGIDLDVTAPSKTVYDAGESLDLNGMTVTLSTSGETPIVLTAGQYTVAAPDISDPGTYEIVVSALGLEDSFIVTVNATVIDYIPYYDDAEGLSGDALFQALQDIINSGFTGVTYGEARYILDDSDRDPNNAANVILVYTGVSVSGTWDAGNTWAREHVWPQSLLGASADNGTVNVCSDLQNLKPINPTVNSSRSNKYFDLTTSGSSYFPGDNDKGDIARILLYMVTKYEYLSLVNSAPSLYQMAMLDVLLLWNEADPVDDFERNRNEVIYSYQHNRNPFVDYPDMVAMIWGQA